MAEQICLLPAEPPQISLRRRLADMRMAASELFDILNTFTREKRHPVSDVIAALPEPFTHWEHCPSGDVEDANTGCAWYYHAHDPATASPWEEHGHFHCFMYTERLGPGAKPMALPDNFDDAKGGLVHLVAISFNTSGAPTRLFAPNRWVTGEWLYPARDLIPLIDQFSIIADPRFGLTSRWLSAILRLYHPQIVALLCERDRILEQQLNAQLKVQLNASLESITEDRSIEIISTSSIDLDASLLAIDQAWERALGSRFSESY